MNTDLYRQKAEQLQSAGDRLRRHVSAMRLPGSESRAPLSAYIVPVLAVVAVLIGVFVGLHFW